MSRSEANHAAQGTRFAIGDIPVWRLEVGILVLALVIAVAARDLRTWRERTCCPIVKAFDNICWGWTAADRPS
jgi:hypothetical protein